MYAFIRHGSGFSGALGYILDEDGRNEKIVQVLGSEGVDVPQDKDGNPVFDVKRLALSFRLQASLRPGISEPVRHLILTCPPEDREKLSPRLWLTIASEYMERMHIENTQFIIAAHGEKDNPHIHIVYNRINNDGLPVEEKFFFKRSNKICKDITKKYGLKWGNPKAMSEAQDIHLPEDRVLYQTARIVTEEVYRASDIAELRLSLMSRGIVMREVRHGDKMGVLFMVKGRNGRQYTFSGSRLGNHLTYPSIQMIFQKKARLNQLAAPRQNISVAGMLGRLASLLQPIGQPTGDSGACKQDDHKTLWELLEERDAGMAGSMFADFTDRRFEEKLS